MPEKWLSSTCEKRGKNNLRIKSNPHVYLQIMTKIPIQENQYKTVGGVVPKRYILLYGDRMVEGLMEGWTDGWKDGRTESRKLSPSTFHRKG